MDHNISDLTWSDLCAGLTSLWLTPDQRSQYLNEWLRRKQTDADNINDVLPV